MGTFDPNSFSEGAFSPSAFDFGGSGGPNAFSFAPAFNLEPSTLTESGGAVITGITGPGAISVSGGEYSIDLGAWTSADGTITEGQSVRVRGTSSANYADQTTVTLTIDGVEGIFILQTRAERTGGDDAPRKKKPKKKRATLTLNKTKTIPDDVPAIYRDVAAEPVTRERAQAIVEKKPLRSITAEDEIALRLLHKELTEHIEQQDEEVIQELLARLL